MGQLAPNGKIYFNTGGNLDVLHVIHSPDSAGAACNFQQHGFQLASAGLTLPNMPHFWTPALGTPCDTVVAVVEVEEKEIEEGWAKIYPNPASEELFVESEGNIKSINIYNNLGQVVYSKTRFNVHYTSIPTERLENGIYWIEIRSENRSEHQSFQVMR